MIDAALLIETSHSSKISIERLIQIPDHKKKHASIVITNDTGLMHIASAFKKKIISLWGCTSPKLGMYPYFPDSKSVIIEPDHIKLRPCSKLGNRCKYGQAVCAKEISVFKIIEAVNDLL